MDVDVIVIGQGLAGTAVAWSLLERGRTVLVIDREHPHTPSRISAGLVTPITGQRLAVSWRFAEFSAAATEFYQRVEQRTGVVCYQPQSMIRVLASDDECSRLAQRLPEEAFSRLVRVPPEPALNPQQFDTGAGSFEMTGAARLQVDMYLTASRNWLQSHSAYSSADLSLPDDIRLTAGVEIPRFGVTASQIVCCEGLAARENPWLQHLRFQPARGDILTVRIPELTERRIVHRGIWLAHEHDDVYRVGATYDWQDFDLTPSAVARAELLGRLQQLIRVPVEVLNQQAAVRPILTGQLPAWGQHPEHPQLFYLNGLGSKAALQAPLLAQQLAEQMHSVNLPARAVNHARDPEIRQ